MKLGITPRETEILDLRRRGYTFKKIGEAIGISSKYAQDIHTRTVKKLHKFAIFKNNYPEFIKAADELGLDYRRVCYIYSQLKKGLGSSIRRWKQLTDAEILELDNCGAKTLEFIRLARTK